MQKYDKLVRDKIPLIITKNGEKPIIKILNDKDFKHELEKKLYEEYQEVINSEGTERLEELADMLEVIKYLAKIEKSDLNEILKIAEKKNEKKGSFNNKIFLEEVD